MSSLTPYRVCIAPMMGWTNRHCRYFHRLLTSQARLYTEMITTGALLQGDAARYLAFNEEEHPIALQIGGNSPKLLAKCAKLAEQWQYDEVNLNCGCPSERVKQGAFGACLMFNPEKLADCVKAMCDAVSIPVTVKHRIGVDHEDSYGFVRDFIGIVSEAGCHTFIVHARKALLKGLNPKQNRTVPPLNYETVYRLKADFPHLTIVLNGGVQSIAQIETHLKKVDGVMLGREAYHNPWILSQIETWLDELDTQRNPHGSQIEACSQHGIAPDKKRSDLEGREQIRRVQHHSPSLTMSLGARRPFAHPITREEVFESWKTYAKRILEVNPVAWNTLIRPLFGLYKGQSGARAWRCYLAQKEI